MSEIKLQVGKTYRNRKGEEVRIVENDNTVNYPCLSSDGKRYTESGKWSYFAEEHPKDLIEEVTMPNTNQNITTKMKMFKLKVGKIYRSRKGEEMKIVVKYGEGKYPYKDDNDKSYTESGRWYDFDEEDPGGLLEEAKEVRHTFAIADDVKTMTIEQVGNRIIVEIIPEERKEPKPGDVMINKWGSIYIFKENYGNMHKNYAFLGKGGNLIIGGHCFSGHPATPEEAQPLFDALKKEGKQWNPETMEVEDVPEIDLIRKWAEEHLVYRYHTPESLTKVIYNYLKYKEDEK